MLSWFRGKAPPTPQQQVSEPVCRWSDDEIPRYPPFMKGLPTVAPDRLLTTQDELIERIADAAIATPQVLDSFYLPAVERFASFAHLLPASQSHHHRGAGGLLRHSIEVGLWALQSADKVLLDAAKIPSQRPEMEPRWQLAVFMAALCHDAGKPVTDVIVTNRDRTTIWKPIKENLHTWAARSGVDAYFLDWRAGRSRQHTALANLIADRIIGAEALEWIGEGETELIVWLMESLNCNPSPANPIYNLVTNADQMSVERDLKTLGVAMAGYDLGVPVERHLTDVMRRFVREGSWLVNEPGARLWNIGSNLYLVWPAAGEEIARQIREDGIPGMPRTPEGILDMLVERKIAFLRDGVVPGDRFWKIAPTCLATKIPDIRLPAIKLRDEAMVSSLPIPPVDGKIIDDRGSGCDADGIAGPLGIGDRPRDAADNEFDIESIQHDVRLVAESARVGESEMPATIARELPAAAPVKPRPSSDIPPVAPIALDGTVGEVLQALAQDLRSGDKRWGVDAVLDPEGHVLLRWPEAFSGYGLTPKAMLDELSRREWIWMDPMAPLKKVLDVDIGGQAAKVICLQPKISQALLGEAATVAGADAVQAGLPPEAMLPQTVALRIQQGGPLSRGKDGEVAESQAHQATSRKRAGRTSKANPAVTERIQPAQSGADDNHEGATHAHAGDENRGRMSKTPSSPSLDEILSVLRSLPGAEQPNGWRTLKKPEVMTACRKRGFNLTHAWLAKLGEQDSDRLVVEEVTIKYRP